MKREGDTKARHRADSVVEVAGGAGGSIVSRACLLFVSAWLCRSWRWFVPTRLGRSLCEIPKQLLDLDERNTLPAVLVTAGPLGVEVRASRVGTVNGPSVWRVGAQLWSSLFRGCLRRFVLPGTVILALFKCGKLSEVPLSATVFDGTQAEPLNPLAVVRSPPEDSAVCACGRWEFRLHVFSLLRVTVARVCFFSSLRVSGRPTW